MEAAKEGDWEEEKRRPQKEWPDEVRDEASGSKKRGELLRRLTVDP